MDLVLEKDLLCTGTIECRGDHRLRLEHISTSDLEPDTIRRISFALLQLAAGKTDIVIPDAEKTMVSCQAIIWAIKWEPFAMQIFNNPSPKNALDATLASCLLDMKHSTPYRVTRISRTTKLLASQEVFSRQDISSSYKTLVGKSLGEIIQGINKIRIQHFIQEDLDFAQAETVKGEVQRGRKRKAAADGEEPQAKVPRKKRGLIGRLMQRMTSSIKKHIGTRSLW
jgi:hypothetical protein